MSFQAENLSEPKRRIVCVIKTSGALSMSELASLLDLSGEAVRQHLLHLEKDGWIVRISEKHNGIGRPHIRYQLTTAGEHLFEKNYDHLTIEVLDTLVNHLGINTLKEVLTAMIDERVCEWEPKLHGLSTKERLMVLKDFYAKDDSYMEVVKKGNDYYLIERNCPFHNVALKRPILCSVTVSVLTKLLGCKVQREQRFQNGDGCCAFRIQQNEQVDNNAPCLIIEDQSSNIMPKE
ncbi:helix-turn-helix transcriptional regulator [Neobacillus drentensis]|uniref:helix-turn-helix transcriptional regulator n=1 Tax=Neobacillus drentensis TaxID=220684 RepID=UPI00285ABE1C|nr:methanogen output domain 1-containing protein [Neobacillus drentensis]MDR7236909.1 putative ArsR family transcriptional regulator [Neobacillus drentensis]